MVKTPKARHSKTKRDPVTIDLDPASVTRVTEEPTPPSTSANEQLSSTSAGAESLAENPSEPPFEETNLPPAEETDTAEQREWAPRDAESEEAAAAASARAEAADTTAHEAERTSHTAPVSSSRGGGTGTAILGGVVGAIIALLLAGGLQLAGVLPQLGAAGGDAEGNAALRQDMSELKTQLTDLKSSAADSGGSDSAALAKRIDDLEASLAPLKQQLGGMEKAQSAAPENLDAIRNQLSELEKQVQAESQSAASTDDLQQRVARVEQGVSQARENAGQAETNADRLAAMQDQLKQLGDKVDAQSAKPGVERLVAATALKSAVDRGAGFAGELEAYGKLGGDSEGLSELRNYAHKGVPTRAELAEEAPDVASRMVQASNGTADEGSFFGRLRESAASLVVVRPVGQVEGDDVPAVAARFEADVKSGAYAKALEEYEKLPDGSKGAGADFAGQLKARAAADRLLDQALSGALKAE